MSEPENTKPAVRPVSQGREYRRLSPAAKQAAARDRQHEPPIACPSCGVGIMPSDLAAHQAERCPLEQVLPPPVAAKWLDRTAALRLAPASRLDAYVERGLVRRREHDDRYLERDLQLVVAWSRALESL